MEDEVQQKLQLVLNTFGRRPLKHNTEPVSKENITIQGKWTDKTFDVYPKHEMEVRKWVPKFEEEFYPDIKKKEPKMTIGELELSRKKIPVPGHGF